MGDATRAHRMSGCAPELAPVWSDSAYGTRVAVTQRLAVESESLVT